MKTRIMAAAIGIASMFSCAATAAPWPEKPIQIIVGYAPGGSSDTIARIVGKALSERLKQSVVVSNKSGASGTIAAKHVALAEPDGYTFLLFTTPILLAKHVYRSIDMDITQELAPVAIIYDLPNVLTVNSEKTPDLHHLKDVIAKAKRTSGGLSFGSGGTGSIGHLSIEHLKQLEKFPAQHIAYRGGAPAVTDLLGGQIDMVNADMIAVLPHIRAGKLTPIAVGATQRVDALPDTPTFIEQGVDGFTALAWGGLLAPKKVPQEVIDRVDQEIKAILQDESVRQSIINTGAIVTYGTPNDMAARLKEDDERWSKVARDNGIALD